MGILIMALTVSAAVPSAAQNPAPTAAPPSPPLELQAPAPDFEISGATRFGVLQNPVRLSDFRGKTVVLAFFPKARTRGCTIQMQSYRDQYAELLHGGRNVVLIAISADSPEDLAAWARDEEFPFLFGSDADLRIASQYGAIPRAGAASTNRNLFVVGPDGTIAYRATPFREIDPTAYTELGAALDRLTPEEAAAP
jgi:peroxiredoxin Q/BCP